MPNQPLLINCCDYDAIVHYMPGEFCTKYKTILSDKIRPVPLNGTLPEALAKTFANRNYHSFLTTEACVLYRVFGQISKSNKPNENVGGARALGGFASTEFAESIIDAKMRLALDPSWLNTKMYEEKNTAASRTNNHRRNSRKCYATNRLSPTWRRRSNSASKRLAGIVDHRLPAHYRASAPIRTAVSAG